ncbi:MAG: hypothetical protein ACD_13C00281G0001 [uncultured bacterium]|nr:MAG: hypothetical protein ACD_13C00281G0001 [uncultured bacterium]
MPKIGKFLKILFPLILASIAVLLSFKNYTSGTYLIGWDSMHPEFNFPLNIERMLSHVWGSEMGVGAISAHSDMPDFFRNAILWLASLVVPASFVRYFYVFACLLLGPLGVYFFLKDIFQRRLENPWVYPAAFLGGVFYLLNLGTLQNFYVPLEMFTVAFAGVPWLFLFGFKYLRDGKKSSLISLSLISILVSPMAYAATQAYAIYFGFFLFLLSLLLFSSHKKAKLKRLFTLGIVVLLLNIYWILPSVYSIAQQSLTISNANINRLFSQESFLRNADYGNIGNVLIQKSFLFTWRNFDFANGTFKDLLNAWNIHLANPAVFLLGYVLAGTAILGIFLALFKKEKVGLSLILPLLLCLFFLFNINPPFGQVYRYLYDNFGVFKEAFRTPFTKFSVLFGFILSFYFGYFWFKVLTLKDSPLKVVKAFITIGKILLIVFASGALIYFSLPMFGGELVGKNVRVAFPKEYAELFAWFDNHPEGRVALTPIQTKYGWEYRGWGYEGSGFLTYGIKNPLLYRDFDRWNSSNEDFYSQAAFALYSNNASDFVATFKKYNVKYLLIDESMINAGASDGVLKISEIKNIARDAGWNLVANFGFLSVYDTGLNTNILSTPAKYQEINANPTYSPLDPLYSANGDYILRGNLTHPFISLDERAGVEIRPNADNLEFRNTLFDAALNLPATESARVDLSINQGFDTAYNCDLKRLGRVFKEIQPSGVLYRAEGGGVSCDYINFPELNYSQAYVLHLTGKNTSGRSLKIYLFDSKTQLPYLEEILPIGDFDETYFVYPREIDGKGYVLNFETRSFGRIPSENLLTGITFYPVDYAFLAGYRPDLGGLSSDGVYSIENNLQINSVQKYGTWGYKIEIEIRDGDMDGNNNREGLVSLGEGYEDGWIAFPAVSFNLKSLSQISELELLRHVKVNNWANGWITPSAINNQNSIIYIFYWPQILEWGGMFAGLICLIVVLLGKKRQLLDRG